MFILGNILIFINNQWIELEEAVAWSNPEAGRFQLTKRLPNVREDGRRLAQYAFEMVSQYATGRGTVLLNPKTQLPVVLRGVFVTAGGQGEVFARAIAYNRPVTVKTPAYVRPAAQILNELTENAKRSARPRTLPMLAMPDARLEVFMIDRDHDDLPDSVEQVYGTDPLNPDTDNDTYLDGEEVANGYNPVGGGNL